MVRSALRRRLRPPGVPGASGDRREDVRAPGSPGDGRLPPSDDPARLRERECASVSLLCCFLPFFYWHVFGVDRTSRQSSTSWTATASSSPSTATRPNRPPTSGTSSRKSECVAAYSRACIPTSSFRASSNNVVFVSFCFQSGYYMPNEKEVKSSYRIAGSPVPDARVFGNFIGWQCAGFDTYELEALPHVNS